MSAAREDNLSTCGWRYNRPQPGAQPVYLPVNTSDLVFIYRLQQPLAVFVVYGAKIAGGIPALPSILARTFSHLIN